MLVSRVQLILGIAEITLDRQGLDLADRGGFDARWVETEWIETSKAMSLEVYQALVKTYLNTLYQGKHRKDAPKVTLNLASHQLIDDIIGWSKLNYSGFQNG